jgi:serine/threonine protein phosphatase PrpC
LAQEFEQGDIERSGTCATTMLVIDDTCYIANTGDSRAIMSVNGGQQVITLSNDHKPTDLVEVNRILKNGGQIY